MTRTRWREVSAVAKTSGPLCAVYAADIGMYLVDMAVVGRLGVSELAGVAVAEQFVFFVIALLGSVASIVVVMISGAAGEGDMEKAIRLLQQGLLISMMLAVPGMLAIWNVEVLFGLLGYDSGVVGHAGGYGRAVVWCVIPYMLFSLLRGFLASVEHPVAIMPTVIVAVVANVPMSYFMTFGAFGLSGFGVAGAGFSTSIVSLFMAASLMLSVRRCLLIGGYSLRIFRFGCDWETWSKVIRKGGPVSISTALEEGMFVVAGMVAGTFGAAALAAHYLANSVVNVAMVFANGVGDATSIRVAFHRGSGNGGLSRKAGYSGLILCVAAVSGISLAMLCMPVTLAGAFVGEDELNRGEMVALIGSVFLAAAVCQLFEGVQTVSMRALRGLEDTFVPMVVALCGCWLVGVPAALVLAHLGGLGVQGVWLGLSCGVAVTGLALTARFDYLSRGAGTARGAI